MRTTMKELFCAFVVVSENTLSNNLNVGADYCVSKPSEYCNHSIELVFLGS